MTIGPPHRPPWPTSGHAARTPAPARPTRSWSSGVPAGSRCACSASFASHRITSFAPSIRSRSGSRSTCGLPQPQCQWSQLDQRLDCVVRAGHHARAPAQHLRGVAASVAKQPARAPIDREPTTRPRGRRPCAGSRSRHGSSRPRQEPRRSTPQGFGPRDVHRLAVGFGAPRRPDVPQPRRSLSALRRRPRSPRRP